jgi:anti-sigma regulatory factor (Ser/Thr protein kinase)
MPLLGRCLRSARFELQTREEAERLAQVLGNMCVERPEVTLALSELLYNAIEHGNLEIGGELKADLLRNGTFGDEIAARGTRSPYCRRHVTVDYESNEHEQVISITDEGAGFDWREVMARELGPSLAPNGRGLLLVRALERAELEFNAAGNSVTMRARW